MSLRWYMNRLRSMEPRELAYRLSAASKKTIDRFRRFGWEQFSSVGECPQLPFLKTALRRNADAAFERSTLEFAARFLEGAYGLHGLEWPKRPPEALFPESFWSLDPATGLPWPGKESFCFSIAYREERARGDIKYVWDLNRLQFMPALACAVALWDDRRALSAIEQAVESWMAANPPYRGVAWNSGVELAIRAASLILCASLCADRLSQQTVLRLRALLSTHLYWLRRYPSRFSSANNHLIYEALGVFMICRAMPGVDPDGGVEDAARVILESEATLQIHADGVSAEQSVSYGAFAAEALLFFALLCEERDGHAPPRIEERLLAFADHISWLCDGDGRTPAIGDDDNGRLIASFKEEGDAYAASIARSVAGLFGQPSTVPARTCPQLRELIFGLSPRVAAAPSGLKRFEQGGYTIVRERRGGRKLRLVFDHAPLGYLSIAAHGHADALSIDLSLDDMPILVDAGTYLYHSGGPWRNWFRGAAAHNTLTLGGENQSRISGPFNWSHKACAWLEDFTDGPDWRLTARHDGYERGFGVWHQRVVSAMADGIMLEDRLLPAGSPESAEIVFQFAPGVSLSGEGLDRVFAIGVEEIGRISFSLPGDLTVKCGEPTCAGGWVSESFGKKKAAPRLVWKGALARAPLKTLIVWSPKED
ncbi:heparinase II/III family protein [Methylocystis parvus]|uniref:Heparinase n=1 Tax=Methylocystis parvus TaxID=134 RepID=A0A6B8MC89_9HYPH|nr:heparinase II/III family protein [Methylocystis parvus]QGM99239.1 heparinase [Methylocystis parvus]WBK00380.1 heparinase II/III family protein [Methylocystis parvus OBBP]